MRYTASLRTFFKINFTELKMMVNHICGGMNFHSSVANADDIIQELYTRMHQYKVLSRYRTSRGAISTYLYLITKRIVLSKIHSEKKKYFLGVDTDISTVYPYVERSYQTCVEQPHEEEQALDHTSLAYDLDSFRRLLLNSTKNKKVVFKNNPNNTRTPRADLVKIFDYYRSGCSSHDVACILDVTDTYAMYLKRQLREVMEEFGITATANAV